MFNPNNIQDVARLSHKQLQHFVQQHVRSWVTTDEMWRNKVRARAA
jgi:hypothetical protein